MKFIYRQMLGFFAVILTLTVILGLLFINVTSRTLYTNTWKQLQSYSDSLIEDSMRYDTATKQFEGFTTVPLENNARLLQRQNVHFTIYSTKDELIYSSSNYSAKITSADWKKLKAGKTIHKMMDRPTRPNGNLRTKNSGSSSSTASNSTRPLMTDVIRPYFYKGKLVAVVSIGSFVSNIQGNLQQIRENLWIAFIVSSLIALLLSYIIARSTTRRIDKMNLATHQIAQGNYNVHLELKGHDELNDLSLNFNQMADSLQESQEEIKRQEDRRRQFMADAAHEMRTPLTTINGLLEGLAYDAIPEEDKDKSIKLMQDDTKRLIRLVNDNLDYEKISNNQISMSRKVFDAADVLHNLAEQLTKKAATQSDSIKVEVPDTLMTYADYDRFVQVLFNIIQNAIQFTEKGVITISGSKVAAGSEFKVSDTGIGMTEDQIKNIWERFYKADLSRMNTKYGESGLGLAIVHQLVSLHGGKIDVASEYGKGTTFTVFFPDREHAKHQSTEKHPSEKE
ncbi:two-component sensor histidine kinase [Paucilactobacillus hokkaidonensis JCM 18461]|uniref:histidine kinase n=2 Tax=Paucilactobacillus hokkaidonensis TaxID=1193095 RepID=A0A0A1H0C5_9LACO|nr:HAMP domain-containing sensor histidine kinase [Paucilactobacillus hokkaidonensis]KRO08950.1 sensor histidine kinase [Paucilactobacillus hokkaidonensis]BAP86136.1 two-component sensor histidine kinase [Paucilactobacillus hokkaidonensis JCM 18461]